MYKVIVAGSRGFDNYPQLKQELTGFLAGFNLQSVEIVSGAAKGADQLGEQFAEEMGCPLKRFPADWETHGKSAGYKRNAEMADYADACICFWDGKSKGTKHMIDLATKSGIIVKVVGFGEKKAPRRMIPLRRRAQ